jgi:hypothetical protein
MNARQKASYWKIFCRLILLWTIGEFALTGSKAQTSAEDVPAFKDDTNCTINCSGMEPFQEYVDANNWAAFRQMHSSEREAVRSEMVRRVLDKNYPRRLRNLAAGVLVSFNDDSGRRYFQDAIATSNPEALRDCFWELGYVGRFGWFQTNRPDMSWAEDLMIGALTNRMNLSRNAAYARGPMIKFDADELEVRELAVEDGCFAEILATMKSVKAMTVMPAMIKENPPFTYYLIGVMGKFGDTNVAPLIMDRLRSGDEINFKHAVWAAIDLKLDAAVPILLEHLGLRGKDSKLETYAINGLERLANKSAIPTLQAKLHFLDVVDQDKIRLLVLKLSGGDQVPSLLEMLRDQKFTQRAEIILRLEVLKDDRAVRDLAAVMKTDKESVMRSLAIRALGRTGTRNACSNLVEGLAVNYQNLVAWKIERERDFNQEFLGEIAQQLKTVTGQDFGTNAVEWSKWLEKHEIPAKQEK